MVIVLKMIFGGFLIGFASWLSGKRPDLAGFITALPLVSIIAIAMAFQTHQNMTLTSEYAKSIILAVPVSWLFFIPFFFAQKWQLNFWTTWGMGLALLVLGYFIHQFILKMMA